MFARWTSSSHKAVEMLALDRGPGMADVPRCLGDGYSTGGSLGQGLGAVRRLSTDFDIYSMPERGTAVYCQVAAEIGGKAARKPEIVGMGGDQHPGTGGD